MDSLIYLAILIAVCIVSGYVVGYKNGRNQPRKVTPYQLKLQTFLIEVGKHSENITPSLTDTETTFAKLKTAIEKDDVKDQVKYGGQLAAIVSKWCVERG
jgi:ABC-type transport system involved in Fe-S cluster assembly fused permease/ATPase subunit